MGSAVSSGVNNDDLVNNLVKEKYITSHQVEQVFRAVDRGHFVDTFLAENFEGSQGTNQQTRSLSRRPNITAYEDLAWREGNLHLSAPCIYTHVMEELDLKSGLSFLNIGSGTGYLNLMVGHIIGPRGCNHGVELHQDCIEYATERIGAYVREAPHFDKFNVGLPEFFRGNGLCLSSECFYRYDRVYCGAAVPSEHIQFMKLLVKPGGVLVLPCGDQLVKITVKDDFTSDLRDLLPVSFASLIVPSNEELRKETVTLPLKPIPTLKDLCRIAIREAIQDGLFPADTTRVAVKPLTRAERIQKRRMSRPNRVSVRRRRPRVEPYLSARSQEPNEHVEESTTNDEDENAPLDSRGHLGFSVSNETAPGDRVLDEEIASGIADNIASQIVDEIVNGYSENESENENERSNSLHIVRNETALNGQENKCNYQQSLNVPKSQNTAISKNLSVTSSNDPLEINDHDSSNDSLRKGFSDIAVESIEKKSSQIESTSNSVLEDNGKKIIKNDLGNPDHCHASTSSNGHVHKSEAQSCRKIEVSSEAQSIGESSCGNFFEQPKRMKKDNIDENKASGSGDQIQQGCLGPLTDPGTSTQESKSVPKSGKVSVVKNTEKVESSTSDPKLLTVSDLEKIRVRELAELRRQEQLRLAGYSPILESSDEEDSANTNYLGDTTTLEPVPQDVLIARPRQPSSNQTSSLSTDTQRPEEGSSDPRTGTSTSVSLPFPIRFFLEMQNNVRALDIDDILNYPGRSLNRLEEEEEGGLFDGEEEGYSGSESSGEEDEGGGEVSGSRQRSAASTGTLSTSMVGTGNESSSRSADTNDSDSSNEGRHHPSVFWVRDRIRSLDLPQFLIDYLLYHRKYIFD